MIRQCHMRTSGRRATLSFGINGRLFILPPRNACTPELNASYIAFAFVVRGHLFRMYHQIQPQPHLYKRRRGTRARYKRRKSLREPRQAANLRGRSIQAEYIAKARAADQKWCGTPAGMARSSNVCASASEMHSVPGTRVLYPRERVYKKSEESMK